MTCPSCGTENRPGRKFCGACGTELVRTCSACGSANDPEDVFCGECGAALAPEGPPPATSARATAARATAGRSAAETPVTASAPSRANGTELRHVSVLFCDLVGFTPFAERRDPEEVRELLSGYFELARAIVARYGGIVEKFIGDAVMAVWGAPVAKEDDAERAVRAGLELVSAVAAYGSEHATELQARVGIVTGGVATTETPEEGLVIGDRVNTAARIQSAAPPGCCYVDETTRAATAAAIAYVDAGEHELKGKAEPVRLFQATRVVAAVAGSQRSGRPRGPLHRARPRAAPRQGALPRHRRAPLGPPRARLGRRRRRQVAARLGVLQVHRRPRRRRALARRALPLLRRGRELLGAVGDGPGHGSRSARRTRRSSSPSGSGPGSSAGSPTRPTGSSSPPASASCSGCRAPQVLAREELFSGWRLFFERLAEHLPVVMVVEDLQWADAGMVDFLDHLLEWSGDHALFLLVLSRPEGTDRKGLGLSRRSVTTLPLDPLADEVIGELLGRPRRRPARLGTGAHRRAGRGDPALRDRDRAGPARQGRPRARATTGRCTSSASSASSRSRPGSPPSSPRASTPSSPTSGAS